MITGESPIRSIVQSYDDWIIRTYARIRFMILRQPFLDEIGQYLPTVGRILDVGCGFGLFSLYFAALEPQRRITGLDMNQKRIDHSRTSAGKLGLGNVQYHVRNALDWEGEHSFEAIYMLDLIHHLPERFVPEFLTRARKLLVPNGILIIKDVSTVPTWKRLFTLILDRLMVGFEPIRYWPPNELKSVLRRIGFDVKSHLMTDLLPYPHILYVCRVPPE